MVTVAGAGTLVSPLIADQWRRGTATGAKKAVGNNERRRVRADRGATTSYHQQERGRKLQHDVHDTISPRLRHQRYTGHEATAWRRPEGSGSTTVAPRQPRPVAVC